MTEQPCRTTSGFALAEMLLAIGLAGMILAFAVGGFSSALRAFVSTERMETSVRRDAVSQRLRHMVSAAWPATFVNNDDGLVRTFFDGRETAIAFATISEGYALPGGIVRVRLWLNCDSGLRQCRLSIGTAVHRALVEQEVSEETGTALEDVASLRFRYWGRQSSDRQARWHDTWQRQDRLPQAIGIRATSTQQGEQEIDLVVQLRNVASEAG